MKRSLQKPLAQVVNATRSQVFVDVAVVGVLILAGLLLRMPGLESGLWRDEGATYFNSIPATLSGLLDRVAYAERSPPGFHLIMHYWTEWFGAEDRVFKLPAFVFGLLLIPGSFLLGRLAHSRGAGFIAAGLMTIAPHAIYYSQEARPFSLTALLCLLTLFLFLKVLSGSRPKLNLVVFAISASMLMYVHYLGVVFVISLALLSGVLILSRLIEQPRLRLVLAFVSVFSLFIPWIPIMLSDIQTDYPVDPVIPWMKRPELIFKNVEFTIPVAKDLWDKLLAGLVLIAVVISTVGGFRRLGVPNKASAIAPHFGLVVVGGSFMLSIVILAGLGIKGHYVLPFLAPAFVLYGGWLVSLLGSCGRRAMVCHVATVLLLVDWIVIPSIDKVASGADRPKSGIRAFAKQTLPFSDSSTVFLLGPDRLGPTFGYYFRDRDVRFYGFGRWDQSEIYSPKGYKELWADPTLLVETLNRIESIRASGITRLVFIRDERTKNSGKLRRGTLTRRLHNELKRRYRLIDQERYKGRIEKITVYVYDLRHAKNS